MNKYIEAIERLMRDGGCRGALTMIVMGIAVTLLVFAIFVMTFATNGLTLLAPLLWWGYIVYKEANKDDT